MLLCELLQPCEQRLSSFSGKSGSYMTLSRSHYRMARSSSVHLPKISSARSSVLQDKLVNYCGQPANVSSVTNRTVSSHSFYSSRGVINKSGWCHAAYLQTYFDFDSTVKTVCYWSTVQTCMSKFTKVELNQMIWKSLFLLIAELITHL